MKASLPSPGGGWSQEQPLRRWARKELSGWRSSRAFFSAAWWWRWCQGRVLDSTRRSLRFALQALLKFSRNYILNQLSPSLVLNPTYTRLCKTVMGKIMQYIGFDKQTANIRANWREMFWNLIPGYNGPNVKDFCASRISVSIIFGYLLQCALLLSHRNSRWGIGIFNSQYS